MDPKSSMTRATNWIFATIVAFVLLVGAFFCLIG